MQACIVPVVVVVVLVLAVLLIVSFDTLEYQEYGLNYSMVLETVEKRPYTSGRYYLGLGNHFIKFPRMVNTVLFSDDQADLKQGPALESRTRDGLNVRLEVSFQYRLLYDRVYDLYETLGKEYEPIFLRMAIEQLSIAATEHDAHFFFTNRSSIGTEMHDKLNNHFKERAFSEVPFFQLRTVHLPQEFEEALRTTQVKQQEIQIASLQQKSKTVTFKTRVLQAEQAVKVLTNQADAEAASILAQTNAYCQQTKVTQNLQTTALTSMVKASGWNSKQLLQYMRIRAVRDHPAEKSMISM
eukprot:TRINITY_DN29672_c0_g1_i1.p1 TRINITY_DN29672_c0_g1~~TRINITY_DN29672_c0_g1_i1.p1  ORF type:complete len:298 (+),score=60.72 TRINITY_DN29672_c0_g1_i1:77-970(+)